MKLELKHLAPYLPYELKVTRNLKKIDTLGIFIGLEFGKNVYDVSYVLCNDLKPILRPLSDLNTNNHVKFIKNYYICFDDFEGFMVKRVNENYTRFNEFDYLFENHFDIFGLIDKGLAVSIHDVG